MANGQLIVKLAMELMQKGQARSWSHALAMAADEAKRRTAAPEGEDLRTPQTIGENRVTAG